jgi:hypothetical protein
MTGDVIRHLWPISLVLLPEAISRDARRLLCFRRQSPIHRKSFYISPELQQIFKKKKKRISSGVEIKKRESWELQK